MILSLQESIPKTLIPLFHKIASREIGFRVHRNYPLNLLQQKNPRKEKTIPKRSSPYQLKAKSTTHRYPDQTSPRRKTEKYSTPFRKGHPQLFIIRQNRATNKYLRCGLRVNA